MNTAPCYPHHKPFNGGLYVDGYVVSLLKMAEMIREMFIW